MSAHDTTPERITAIQNLFNACGPEDDYQGSEVGCLLAKIDELESIVCGLQALCAAKDQWGNELERELAIVEALRLRGRDMILGKPYGILLYSREFEFKRSSDGVVLYGRLSHDLDTCTEHPTDWKKENWPFGQECQASIIADPQPRTSPVTGRPLNWILTAWVNG